MEELVDTFKKHVIELANKPKFPHHAWYIEYHLNIVERISLELLDKYPEADANLVRLLTWLHDYGKIVDHPNQYTATLTEGRKALLEVGFSQSITDTMMTWIEIFDGKENLHSESTPIEVKIVSSADAASHLVGPFFYLYWYEYSDKPFKDLMAENVRKATVDWDKKVVLPEIHAAFNNRHEVLLEQAGGIIPDRFL
jgi:hypothetical protein